MFAAGFATFALLYVVQPLLPLVGRRFEISPATSSLTLAVSTAGLAVCVLPLARLSERYGRARVLHLSLALAAGLGLAAAYAPSFAALLVIRALPGAALGGVPAAALAWVAEEVHSGAVARAGGLYIAGTSVGGMTGRLLGGALADVWGWRGAVFGVGLLSVVAAAASIRLIPIAAVARAREPTDRKDAGPRIQLYLIGGLGMAAFVGIYNVLSYRLEAAPYGLSPSVSGLVFLAYLAGTFTSAQSGRVRDRLGLAGSVGAAIAIALAGLALTLATPLALVVIGITLLTGGFFLLHAIASSTVSARAARPSAAAARYLLVYYLGSSLGGPLLGLAWSAGGWTLAAGAAGALLVAAGLLSVGTD
jgi:YNFM family putative membrane transporter